MDHTDVGTRQFPRVAGPDDALIEALGRCDPTDLSDAMHSSHFFDSRIKPLYTGIRTIAGTAITVYVPVGSQHVRKIAMDMAKPGDVLVVAGRGVSVFAMLGGQLAARLKQQGLAGVVIDGYVRDRHEIEDVGLPVFCRGETVASAPKTGAGEINIPVACGDVVVHPGDVVVGNANGVVVVPRQAAAAVLDKVLQGSRIEEAS